MEADYVVVLSGSLLSGYGDTVQCCGGQVVSSVDRVCCGDDVTGQSYSRQSDKYCCGQLYVDTLTTHCCVDSHSRAQVVYVDQ